MFETRRESKGKKEKDWYWTGAVESMGDTERERVDERTRERLLILENNGRLWATQSAHWAATFD